jgi:hypothetical protein
MSQKKIDRRKKNKPPRKKSGIMLKAYCTNRECDRLDFHEVVKVGTRCACGYPLSWLGPKLKEKNKYAEPKKELDEKE